MKAVVVTGASTGIGAATALRLAQDGIVAFAGVRSDADALRLAALHPNIRPLRLDVTDGTHLVRAAAEVTGSGYPLMGLVNNAGIAVAGALEYLPIDDLRHQFEVNVVGALAATQAFLPQLRAAGGRIVFIGSISGRLAVPFIGPYSASKFALRALVDALRVELRGSGVGVTLLEPGSVKTPIWAKGRASRTTILASLGAEGRARYGAAVERVIAQTETEERSGMPVDTVVEAIVAALTARRSFATRLLGTPARAGSVIALLPPALRDRAVSASLKLPRANR